LLVFVFPGQGSQKTEMGKLWTQSESWELVKEASDILGCDLENLLLTTDPEMLVSTENSQLAVFLASMLAYDAILRTGLVPGAVAGHSLGEYSALVASGALSFADGLQLVAERGQAMKYASEINPGTMAALLGIDAKSAENFLREIPEVWIANENSDEQLVIAGSMESIETAISVAKQHGVKKTVQLKVGGAFHTPLMEPARGRLEKKLKEMLWKDPEVPIYANVDAKRYDNATAWPKLLSAQLTGRVRWREIQEQLLANSPDVYVEVGPGGVLYNLARKKASALGTLAFKVESPGDIDELLIKVSKDHAVPASDKGEVLFSHIRLVVSYYDGTFNAEEKLIKALPSFKDKLLKTHQKDPIIINAGEVIGYVGENPVASPFEGKLLGILTLPLERVTKGQPVAWLEVET
jgi:[acyl-carrier-protein] S-malonyltransferase